MDELKIYLVQIIENCINNIFNILNAFNINSIEFAVLSCSREALMTTDILLLFCASDRTIKLWNIEAVVGTGHTEEVLKLSSQAVVAAHDKDINSLAVAPNDSLICSGSQVL